MSRNETKHLNEQLAEVGDRGAQLFPTAARLDAIADEWDASARAMRIFPAKWLRAEGEDDPAAEIEHFTCDIHPDIEMDAATRARAAAKRLRELGAEVEAIAANLRRNRADRERAKAEATT